MFDDLRYAVRMLMKRPGFTAVAVLTLAVGIGANTAVFSFVNAILLRPLPYPDSDRLVMVWQNNLSNGWAMSSVSPPMLGEWRSQSTVFEGLAAGVWGTNFTLTGRGEPQSIRGTTFSANIFSVLRVKPVLGRDFLPHEEEYGNHHVVLLSHELWQRQFGGDPQIIGQSITLNAEAYTIIGVMPPQTEFPSRGIELWTPLAFTAQRLAERNAHNYIVYGRLKRDVTIEQADAELAVISRRLEEADEVNKGFGAFVLSLLEMKVGNWRPTLLLVLGAVGFVLLVACANIANLVLARSIARTREFSIRAALGAGRGQVIRQLLTEGLLLAVVGGLGGVIVASLALKALVHLTPPNVPRISEGIQIDGITLGFAAAAILLTGLIFGLLPALQFSNPALAKKLNESSRGSSAGVVKQRLRSGLAVAQVALSVMLLIGAGLMIRSFSRLLSQPLGFRAEQLVRVHITLPLRKYPDYLMAFAATGVLLSAIGIYGLLSYSIVRRTREIGIRMAMGAQRRDVLRMVMASGIKLVLIGAACGLVAAWWMTRFIQNQLHGVSATDPVVMAGVVAMMLVVAMLACYMPARRAARVDPMAALRSE